MNDYTNDFSISNGHAWLNAASEGPIPKIAVQALQEAVVWKSSPHLLSIPKFQQVPIELKQSLAQLLNVNHEDIILGNSATYGLHLLANGLTFNNGDEIILMQNDFPTNILPWLSLEKKGIVVRQLKPQGYVLTADEIMKAITPSTKAVCLSYIHTFSGHALDVEAIGKLTQEYGILFIVNLSQAAGAFPVNLARLPIDAVVGAGYKWLLGPYGTGYCWMKKEIREKLNYPQNYWISLMNESDLSHEGPLVLRENNLSRRYDVFGTANFFNFVPWKASIDYLLSIGIDQIQAHNQTLVEKLRCELVREGYQLISPKEKNKQSNIVVFSHQDALRNASLAQGLKEKGVHLALWKNKLRASPHIYNQMSDIDRLMKELYESNKQ